jgi:hypothetical protein
MSRVISPLELESQLESRLEAIRWERGAAKRRRQRHGLLKVGTAMRKPLMLVAPLAILSLVAGVVVASGLIVNLTSANATATVNGAVLSQSNFSGSTGTGVFDSFVRFQASGTEQGYNTSGRPVQYDELTSPFTRDLPLNQVPLVNVGGTLYREFRLDINEIAGTPSGYLSIDRMRMFVSTIASINSANPDDPNFGQTAASTSLVWDLDGAGDRYVKLDYNLAPGSGNGDMKLLVPNSNFGTAGTTCQYNGFNGASCGYFVYLYTKAGEEFASDDGFEEWSVRKAPFVNVAKTATTTFTRTFGWTIDKSVTPATWDLFRGDSGTSEYTVAVTKDAGTGSGWGVSGTITITNPSGADAVIQSVSDTITGGITATVSCGVTFPYTLANGGTLACTYSASLPNGTSRVNTATVTLADSGSFTGTANVTFGSPTTLVYDTIHVTDTNGSSWTFGTSGSENYDKTFTCDGDEGTHNNTATITETNQSDSASVTVNCYALGVTKDATTGFTRTYHWTILKSSDDPNGHSLLLNPGETYVDYPYEVTVDATYTESGWGVSGNIHVHNPAPIAATLNSVSDAISGVGAATVDCGVTFPYSLAAGATLDCTYSADLPDTTNRTNTATATLQNHSYDKDGNATDTGTTDFTGTASVSFASATMTEIDKTITVTDTYAGTLGTATYGVDTLPKTFTYNRTFGPFTADECGDHDFPNTATFTTNDTKTTGFSDWDVVVTVPCPTGCTLTQGYWKTHSSYGPATPPDATWILLPSGPDTTFFLSGQTWYQVFWTAPKGGNAYYILAHQYEAAKLNILSGADSTAAVDAAILWAETTFFNTYTPSSTLSKAVRNQAIYYAGILGQYNEGLIGPGHCSEDSVSAVTSGARLALIIPIAIPLFGSLAIRAARRRLRI